MQNFYWVTFAKRSSGCIEAKDLDEARARARAFDVPVKLEPLPYPANPRLDVRSDCPSFCYDPGNCKGRTACPKNPSCCS